MSRKAFSALTLEISVPTILVLLVVLALAIMFLAKMLSATINVNDRAARADTALYAMLNSNDCTPNTKLPFKDVVGIAIAQQAGYVNLIKLEYGGKTDILSINTCVGKLKGDLWITDGSFCMGVGNNACTTHRYNIISTEYIALPDGNIGKVVLEVPG